MREKPVRAEGVREREIGGETMLYDAEGRAVHVLNRTAGFVWHRCDGSRNAEQIAAEAQAVFGGSGDAIRGDVDTCLAELREKGLLRFP